MSSPLDDFLAGADTDSQGADLLQGIGLGASLIAIIVATGLVVFLAAVHRGAPIERRRLLRLVSLLGVVAVAGAAMEVAGIASRFEIGWSEALTDGDGAAPMLRFLAGMLIALGLYDIAESGHIESGHIESGHIESGPGEPTGFEPGGARWRPTSASAFGLVGIAVGVLSFSFDGHTVTNGPRIVHLMLNLVHVLAGGVWVGGIAGLVIVGVFRRRSGGSIGALVVRFSTVATLALIAVAVAGVAMALFIIDGFGDFTGTPWGRRLLIKVALVGVASVIGAYNHFVVVPQLDAAVASQTTGVERRVARALRVEAVVLLGVTIMTVLMVRASTV